MNWNPVWLPDGRLSYTSMRKGDFDVYVKDVGGTGAEHAVLAGPDDTDPIAWTRDGRLVFQGSEPDGAYPLKLFDPRQPAQITRLTEQHVDNGGSLSPDERWLAYQSAAIGRSVVYVRPLDQSRPRSRCRGTPESFRSFSATEGRLPSCADGSSSSAPGARTTAASRSARNDRGAARVRIGLDIRRTVRRGARRPVPRARPHRAAAAAAHSRRARMGSRSDPPRGARRALT